jgi:uncharacterized membrane protein YfcA
MSLMTQSVGMNCAAFTILYQKIRIEPNALLFSSCGGAFGVVVGLQWVAPNLPPSESKLIFVRCAPVRAVCAECRTASLTHSSHYAHQTHAT